MKIIIIDKEKNLYHFDNDNKRFASYLKENKELYVNNNLESFLNELKVDYKKIDLNISSESISEIDFTPTYYGITLFDLNNKVFLTAFNDYDNVNYILNPKYYLSDNYVVSEKEKILKDAIFLIENKIFSFSDEVKDKQIINDIKLFLNKKEVSKNLNTDFEQLKLSEEYNKKLNKKLLDDEIYCYKNIIYNVLNYNCLKKDLNKLNVLFKQLKQDFYENDFSIEEAPSFLKIYKKLQVFFIELEKEKLNNQIKPKKHLKKSIKNKI